MFQMCYTHYISELRFAKVILPWIISVFGEGEVIEFVFVLDPLECV